MKHKIKVELFNFKRLSMRLWLSELVRINITTIDIEILYENSDTIAVEVSSCNIKDFYEFGQLYAMLYVKMKEYDDKRIHHSR